MGINTLEITQLLGGSSALAIGVALLIIGMVECFWGYQLFRVQVGLLGFLSGLSLGFGFFPSDGTNWILPLIVGVLLGALLCGLALRFFPIGVFLFVAFLVFTVIYAGIYALVPFGFWIALIIAIIAGFVGVFLSKPIIIISTSFSGAGMVVNGGLLLLGWTYADVAALAFILTVVLTVAGLGAQFKYNKGKPFYPKKQPKTSLK